ncbi:N-(5'-phosphoribosyl)anthranilate isomerase [Pseudovibrio axinellae]|uniref:N-(5'-phosphoribosyl)anthranilate isomerase n=1 Tax=Pseudovibrio axinellae TaxID=989403 RepID=A0A165ZMJ3_9HYPH|nr:phosphoribosylanthranilate isomerase [Pseudovibrio axinellae]KZL20063.1 N-(5'-phosphoribosyl)anthranilate isomerase [Pseudovibrio axinellae]SEQ27004.1 phosphoribosylanthranilate isomerase [Pseudovibrio axinellae]
MTSPHYFGLTLTLVLLEHGANMDTSATIKICGISTKETADTVINQQTDMIGFVFFSKSPRNVSIQQAKELAEHVRGKAQIVALTVNMDDAGLREVIDNVAPDILQLHGNESPERCAEIRKTFGIPVMKAFGISCAEDLETVHAYVPFVDRLLFDAKPPKSSDIPGGNGVSFDWKLLQGLELGKPIMLSGGLGPENVREALAISGVHAVDVSSGVERERGVKDIELIKAFVQEVRSVAE